MKEFIVKKQTTEWAVIWADSKKDAEERARTTIDWGESNLVVKENNKLKDTLMDIKYKVFKIWGTT